MKAQHLFELPVIRRYRYLCGMAAMLFGLMAVGRMLGDVPVAWETRSLLLVVVGGFALFGERIAWTRDHPHAAMVLSCATMLLDLCALSLQANLSAERVMTNFAIMVLVAFIIDHRGWLQANMVMWVSSFVVVGYLATSPAVPPLLHAALMVCTSAFLYVVVSAFTQSRLDLADRVNDIEHLQEFAQVGSWTYNLSTNTFEWSDKAFEIVGSKPGAELPTLADLFVSTEDELYKKTIEFIRGQTDTFSGQGQIVRLDGKPAWLDSRGKTVYQNGVPVLKQGVFTDISDHIAKEQALEDSAREAEAAMEARTQFLANMSHEIRTPLNGVIGMASLLETSELKDQEQKYVEVIRNCGESLLNTVNDILDFTKLDAGKVMLEQRVFRAREVIDKSVAVVEKQARDKGLRLHVAAPTVGCDLVGDPLRLQQILVNLLTNAVKFSSTGVVELRYAIQEQSTLRTSLRFEVFDTGIGISDEVQAHLFNPFVQADATTTRSFGGTGLGLSICKQLVEQMGGEIGVKSTLGEGSTFWFEVPFRNEARFTSPEDVTTPAEVSTSSDFKILVAEDNPVNQQVMQRMLKKLGLEATLVGNGAEAVESVQNEHYDLVLMDVQMPVLDGMSATRQIRKLTEAHQPRIIAVTANAMKQDREDCLDAGMDDFLAKPMRLDDLGNALGVQAP